jgi:hypothetical protein
MGPSFLFSSPTLTIQGLLKQNPKIRTEAWVRSPWRFRLALLWSPEVTPTSLGPAFGPQLVPFRAQTGASPMSEGHSKPPLFLISHPICHLRPFIHSERSQLEVETSVLSMLC